ncbi:MAG: hypothetical protein AB1716_17525 [Planctomycetota bacterium]
MRSSCAFVLAAAALAGFCGAQPVFDGSAADPLYGAPLAIQDTQTGFGDASLGRPDVANGSELDVAHAVIYNGKLYLVLAGNLESNGNKLELFFDTRAGGQNRLLATNPGQPNAGLLRMCEDPQDPNSPGLTFDTGFEADFWVSVALFGGPPTIYVDYAELYVDAQNPGVGYYVGEGLTKCTTNGGQLVNGDPNAPAILCTADNSNVRGVTGGFGLGDGSGVTTGIELAIPLAALGNPGGALRICAFVNGQQHDFVSNQVLGGILAQISNNLGEPRRVNFASLINDQFFTVAAAGAPVGACCVGQNCLVTTPTDCAFQGGTYRGDNVSCDGNPCDATPSGRCCFDDGYSGQCAVLSEVECTGLGGSYGGDGTTCAGCPCLLPPKGACCTAGGCTVTTEAECLTGGGTYVGDFTSCTSAPCDQGACCTGVVCTEVYRFACTAGGGRFVGPGVPCSAGLCDFTIATPHVAGDFQGWNAGSHPMNEDPPGSHIYTLGFTGVDPNSRHEWKVTDGTWNNSIPGANSWLWADPNGAFMVRYDANFYADGWLPERDRLGVDSDPGAWTATGDFLAALGGSNWNNADPHGAMAGQGGGVYKLETTAIPAGDYKWKAVVTGTWDSISRDGRSVNTQDWSFAVPAGGARVVFWVDALGGRAKLDIVPAQQVCRGDLNCDAHIDFNDINAFVMALSDYPLWQRTYGSQSSLGCPDANADVNADGRVDFGDINPFVGLLTAGRDCPNP